jgi:thiol:disulfide interchange protein DsbD
MRLATETRRVVPGEATLAVVFEIDEQWHLYWKNSGDTGLPPAVDFTLPEGVELAGELQWPAPKRYIHGAGQLLDYIYEDEFALLQPVRIDSSLLGETVTIEARGTWLVCKEACLPGEGADRITLEVSGSAGGETEEAALIEAMRDRVPVPGSELDLSAAWDGRTLVVSAPGADRMEILPLEPALGGPENAIDDGADFGPELRVPYGERVSDAERVVAVVGVSRDGVTRWGRLELAAPGRPAG